MINNINDILDPYSQWHEKINKFLGSYKLLYNLPLINNTEEISSSFYNYCIKGKYFVVIALYNSKREFFVQRDFLKRTQSWELVGGWLTDNELFDQALDRVVLKETGSKLVEAFPIAIVNNTYTCGNKKIHHIGIAFSGRVLDEQPLKQDGVFTTDPSNLVNNSDTKILEIAKTILKQKVIDPPVDEVESHTNRGLAGSINRYFVKPIAFRFCSYLLYQSIQRYVHEVCKKGNEIILDVACGDDQTILKLTPFAKITVANDISRESMQSLIRHSKDKKVLFTNHNVLELKFNVKFEVVICKNVMHHMRNADEIELLMIKLKELGKRIIIMDIENPKLTLLASLWNRYYVKFLHDHGGLFISAEQLKDIVNISFPNAKKIRFNKIKTIKGNYMVSIIDQRI